MLFAIGGGIAGLAGALFVNWGSYADPGLFSLFQSAQIIIWVIVGGLGTLLGPVLGAVLLHFVTTQLGTLTVVSGGLSINNSLVLGTILILFVLLVPKGLVPSAGALWRRLRERGQSRHSS